MAVSDLLKGKNLLIIMCFFFGHAVFHLMGQSFSVLLPSIQNYFGINAVQVGALITVREIVSGLVSLPGGMLSDYLNDYRAYILTACLVLFGVGWLIIAAAPVYPAMYLGMVVIAVASSLWHLPSLVELGSRFAGHRGAVFAIHGAGGSVGDVVGPVITGLLLVYLSWQQIISLYVLLPVILAGWTFLIFIKINDDQQKQENILRKRARPSLGEQFRVAGTVLRNTHILRVNLVAGLRGMCFTTLVTFLPIFMHDIGFSSRSIGFHFGMLWAIGLVASPFFGHLSDKLGRKIILVPALLYSSLMVALLALWGEGIVFTILIVLLGFAIRSDYSLINATILDLAGNQVETTMLGILSLFRYSMGAVAPLIAGALYQYVSMQATFLFVALLFLVAALLFASVDLKRR